MNTTSNTRLWLNYPSFSRPPNHWSATDPRNQQTTFRVKTHQHAQRKLARLLDCATSVRPVTPVRPVDRADQAGGYNSHTTNVPESLSDFSRPWNTNTPNNATCTEEEPYTKSTKTLLKLLRTDQHQHNPKTHGFSNSPEENPTKGSPSQTGQENQLDRCNLGSSGWTIPTGQLLQNQLPISRFAPRIRTRLWG
jgi:hypothetical protein